METSLPTLVAPELNSSSLTLRDPAPIHSLRPRHGRRFNHLRLRYRLQLGHRSRHTCLRDFLLWLSCLRLCAPDLLSLNLIDGCRGHFTERSICVPFGCWHHAVSVRSIIRSLSDRIQTEFHLAPIGLRARRTFATAQRLQSDFAPARECLAGCVEQPAAETPIGARSLGRLV